MRPDRRHVLAGALAAPALLLARGVRAARDLKVSHQFPGGTDTQGDFRDQLCRRFAAAVTERSAGALTASVYPNSSLMKTNAQFSAMRKGALDLSLFPLAYAGGEIPEVNIGLMPCIVSSYAQGAAWKTGAVGERLSALLADKGIVIVSWVWQSDGVISRSAPIGAGSKYALKQREKEMKLSRDVRVGYTLPADAMLIDIPPEFDLGRYRLALANQKTLLVDPATRRVEEVIE